MHNRADKMEVEMVDGVVQTEASPAYRWGPFLAGKFYTRREGHVKITYDKQNRNVMMVSSNSEPSIHYALVPANVRTHDP